MITKSETVEGLKHVFDGRIELMDCGVITGWVIDKTDPKRLVTLRILVAEEPVAAVVANKTRNDIQAAFGGTGRNGFEIRLPLALCNAPVHSVKVLPDRSDEPLKLLAKLLQDPERRFGIAGQPHRDYNSAPVYVPALCGRRAIADTATLKPQIALIVLNRNGAFHLEQLFSSFRASNTYRNFKFIVIDHGSHDGSAATLEKWSQYLPIAYYQRGYNHSFSESNNLGVHLAADAEFIVFINNDIEFVQDILGPMSAYFTDQSIGGVGVQLLRKLADAKSVLPETHHLGISIDTTATDRPYMPYELPPTRAHSLLRVSAWDTPAVTAALLMIRRSDACAVGGFDEGYFYGYEDVDLCLLIRSRLKKRLICANELVALHAVGATRSGVTPTDTARSSANAHRLAHRTAAYVRSVKRDAALGREPNLLGAPMRMAFAVTSTDFAGVSGDYFTAHELGESIQNKFGWEVWYLEPGQWYEAAAFDIVIAMRHDFDPGKFRTLNPYTVCIAWARNWFDVWLKNARRFDQVWAASQRAADIFALALKTSVPVIRLATNATRFNNGTKRDHLNADYCFTGSYFKADRQIIRDCDPRSLPYKFAVFGHNWDQVPQFSGYWRGALNYLQMPDLYASTKIVIDDANHTTISWGSVNSRVFDALASRALVITNGELGGREVFGGKLPVYRNASELAQLLATYLGDDENRTRLVGELNEIVLHHHTYNHRAEEAVAAIRDAIGKRLRTSIQLIAGSERLARDQGDRLRGMLNQLENFFVRAERSRAEIENISRLADDVCVLVVGDGQRISHLPKLRHQTHVLIDLTSPGIIAQQDYAAFDIVASASAENARVAERANVKRVISLDYSGRRQPGNGSWGELWSALSPKMGELGEAVTKVASDKSAVPLSECFTEVRTEQLPRIPLPYKIVPSVQVRFFPDYRPTNPYQQLLYSEFKVEDVKPGSLDQCIGMMKDSSTTRGSVIFHLHWTSVVIGTPKSRSEAEARVASFLHKLTNFRDLGGRLFWTIHNKISHESEYADLERFLCAELCKQAEKIHVHSLKTLELVSGLYSVPATKVLIAEHGNYIVDSIPNTTTSKDARIRLGLPLDATVFLFFGQVRGYKGIDNLISAFEELSKLHPDAWLVVAGQPYRLDGESYLKTISRNNRIICRFEFIDSTEIQLYMNASDAVVLPYRDVLTSGSVLLAFSFGIPVIVPAIGLLTEIVSHGVNGVVYDLRESNLLVALQSYFKLSKAERNLYSAAALLRAKAFPWRPTSGAILREMAMPVYGFERATVKAGRGPRSFHIRRVKSKISSPTVGTIVLHYSGIDDTIRCVSALRAQVGVNQEIIVVSSSETPHDAIALSRIFLDTTVVQMESNLGYAGGNNLGLLLAREAACEWFWIVNPDTAVDPRF